MQSKHFTLTGLVISLLFLSSNAKADCYVNGGWIRLLNGKTQISICAGDGVSDAFQVALRGKRGNRSAWVITDDKANILALPAAPPFDLEGAGPGVCLVWHLSYEPGLTGLQAGKNAKDLKGCFDLSNPITVYRNGVNGGELALATGGKELTICAGDGVSDAFNVSLKNNTGKSAWVITDDKANILALPPSPPFDLEGAGPGTCLIWHLSYQGQLKGAQVGKNAKDLKGCFDLSNPITVYRESGADCMGPVCQVDGGKIALANGATSLSICAGDGKSDAFDVKVTGSFGTMAAWVITDDKANILALPASPPFDLEGAGAGTCLVWYLRFEAGLKGAQVGKNAKDLMGCFDLSNPITVYRNGVNGGELSLRNGRTELTICAGDGKSDAFHVDLKNNTGKSAWVITDDKANILALPPSPPFDLEGAGPGTCIVWHLSYEGTLTGVQVGKNAADLQGCFDLSNPVTVYRNGVNGGNLSLMGGGTELTICAGDGVSDAFNVALSGYTGARRAWVITDDKANILALPASPPFDLEGAGAGICLVWHLTYEPGLRGLQVGRNAANLSGCYDLSNPITVIRQLGSACGGSLVDPFANSLLWSNPQQVAAGTDFDFSPNPALDVVRVNIHEVQDGNFVLSIYNLNGQLVKRLASAESGSIMEISVAEVPQGVYVINLSTDKGSVSKKLIVSR